MFTFPTIFVRHHHWTLTLVDSVGQMQTPAGDLLSKNARFFLQALEVKFNTHNNTHDDPPPASLVSFAIRFNREIGVVSSLLLHDDPPAASLVSFAIRFKPRDWRGLVATAVQETKGNFHHNICDAIG